MIPTILDPSLDCQCEDDRLVRINGSYVDDLLRAGMDEWQIPSDATLERFGTTANKQAPFTFAGMHVTESDIMHLIDQDFHWSKVEHIPSNNEFSKYASMRMKLAWLASTRSDVVFQISLIAQLY